MQHDTSIKLDAPRRRLPCGSARTLRTLRRRLDSLALEQLREAVVELQARLEQAERRAAAAEDAADYWREHAFDLQAAAIEGDGCTHKAIGITQEGQLMVVRTEGAKP